MPLYLLRAEAEKLKQAKQAAALQAKAAPVTVKPIAPTFAQPKPIQPSESIAFSSQVSNKQSSIQTTPPTAVAVAVNKIPPKAAPVSVAVPVSKPAAPAPTFSALAANKPTFSETPSFGNFKPFAFSVATTTTAAAPFSFSQAASTTTIAEIKPALPAAKDTTPKKVEATKSLGTFGLQSFNSAFSSPFGSSTNATPEAVKLTVTPTPAPTIPKPIAEKAEPISLLKSKDDKAPVIKPQLAAASSTIDKPLTSGLAAASPFAAPVSSSVTSKANTMSIFGTAATSITPKPNTMFGSSPSSDKVTLGAADTATPRTTLDFGSALTSSAPSAFVAKPTVTQTTVVQPKAPEAEPAKTTAAATITVTSAPTNMYV